MNGKIFPESGNIYQDQAKILFDYYQQAAERIVAEEERIEKEIRLLQEDKAMLEKEISGLWIWFLTIILFFMYFIKKNELQKKIDEIDSLINEFEKQHDEIFRDYKVTKLGVAYVPIADQMRYTDKSFIVDYTGGVQESELTMQLPRKNDLLIETIGKLEQLSNEAPIVESSDETETIETDDYSTSIQELNQHNYIGNMERSLRTIAYCMEDLDTTSVSLPLVTEGSSYQQFLNEFATREIPEDAQVISVFNKEYYADSIEKFQELNKLKDSLSTKTQQFEDVLKSLMMTMANSVQAISSLKMASVNKVVFESNKLLFNILKAPYNHYSPMLEFDEIERIRNEKFDYGEDIQNYEPFKLKQSSRVKFNLHTGTWTAEDGSTTNMPFGVHQIYEEIVAPVVQNLMMENRVERLKIYNHIKDQKIDYLNKWHQDTDAFYRANRAESSDIINLMQESLREYVAAYNTLISLKRTEDSMMQSNGELDSTVVNVVDNTEETLAAFELQSQEFQKTQTNFEEYMERLKEDIDMKAEKFGHVEYYDAKLRDGYSNEVAVAASEIHNLDERRKSLAAVNPLFAKTSELLPQPNVENITFEHISLNLPAMARNVLEELEASKNIPENETKDQNASTSTIDSEESIDYSAPEAKNEKNSSPQEYTDKDAQETFIDGDEDEEYIGENIEEAYEDDDYDEDDNNSEYTLEELEEMTDDELKEILQSMKIEYDDENFTREAAITNILENSENNN